MSNSRGRPRLRKTVEDELWEVGMLPYSLLGNYHSQYSTNLANEYQLQSSIKFGTGILLVASTIEPDATAISTASVPKPLKGLLCEAQLRTTFCNQDFRCFYDHPLRGVAVCSMFYII
jgi:hypothetical protein